MTEDATSGHEISSQKYPIRTRRTGNKQHPGVVLIRPHGRHRRWRARFRDASGKTRKVTLEDKDCKTQDTRLHWARKLSEQLQQQRSEVKAGIVRTGDDLPLVDAVERYFTAHPRLSTHTVRSYRTVSRTLIEGREHMSTKELTPAVLAAWRLERTSAKRSVAKPDGSKGQKRPTKQLRSAHSVNKDFRSLHVLLEWWRRQGMLVINTDDIGDALKPERTKTERKSFLTAVQIKELLAVCRRYDKQEKYPAITPFIRFLALTGVRLNEGLLIEWADLEGDQIHVRAEIAKWQRARDVDLSVAKSAVSGKRGVGLMFGLTGGEVAAARKRLKALGAPSWSPQGLRRTCSTFFCCAFGPWRAAKSLGHSVKVMEKNYAGLVKVPNGCKSLEQAMGI
jgi:integrase